MSLQTDLPSSQKLGKVAQLIKFPLQRVHLELTNACNFDCVFCPKTIMTRSQGRMETGLAKSIIRQLAEHNITEKVTFHVMGEPMLHPDFFDIAAYVREQGMKSGLTTNGSFLNERTAGILRELEIDQVNISLQTPFESSFQSRKAKGMSFEDYCGGILDTIRILRSQGGQTTVKIHFLVTRFNKSIAEATGMPDNISDSSTLKKIFSDWTNRIYDLPDMPNNGTRKRVLNALSRVSINRWNVLEVAPGIHFETYLLDSWGNSFGKGAKTKVESRRGYCPALTDHFGVLHNGDFILCCKDFDGKTRVGNVAESGLIDLLNSPMVLSVVEGFKQCKVVHPRCRVCLGGKNFLSALSKQAGSIFFFRLMKWFFYNQKTLYH